MAALGGAAGGSSQRKYNELSRAWRRRKRKVLGMVTLICGAVVIMTFVGARTWPSAGWMFGLIGGAAMALAFFAREIRPGWIENWQLGAWGEQETAKALRVLEAEGWVAFHDLPAGRGNVDHIVVGPGGVYLLDSKNYLGSAIVDESGVQLVRREDPELGYRRDSRQILALARQTHGRVRKATRLNVWVTPVMVLWAEFPQRVREGKCVYVHGNELATWLRSRPQVIAPGRVQQVADAVHASWMPTFSPRAVPNGT